MEKLYKIKPLEWTDITHKYRHIEPNVLWYRAEGMGVLYDISFLYGAWELDGGTGCVGSVPSLEDGKAKAEAHYRERMASGLVEVPIPETHRWNIEKTSDGDVLVCRGGHDKHEPCDEERWVRAERLDALSALLAAEPGKEAGK